MEKITFTEEVKFGDKLVSEINIEPLTFVGLSEVWAKAATMAGKPQVTTQRARILRQTHFMVNGERYVPDAGELMQLPRLVAKQIIDMLDLQQGVAGQRLNDGDGATTSVLYKLGTPIEIKGSDGKVQSITELEFKASTYGEVEDILAAENEIAQTMELLRRIAKPATGPQLMALPSWALDRITVADGVTIMREILPRF